MKKDHYLPFFARWKWFTDNKRLCILIMFIFNLGIGYYTAWYLAGYFNNNSAMMDYASGGLHSSLGVGLGLVASIIRSYFLSFNIIIFIGIILMKKLLLIPNDWFILEPNRSNFIILFKDEETYKQEINNLLFQIYDPHKIKMQERFSFFLALFTFGVVNIYNLIIDGEFSGTSTKMSESLMYQLVWGIPIVGNIIMGTFIFYIAFVFINIFQIINRFGKLESINYVGKQNSTVARASYQHYHNTIRIMGDFLFKSNLFIIIAGVIVSVGYYFTGMTLNYTYSLSVLIGIALAITISLILFFGIQFGIHKNLIEGKRYILSELEKVLNQKRLILQKYTLENKTQSRFQGEYQEMFQSCQYLKWEIEGIEELGTWAFRLPKIITLFGASSISFIAPLVNILS
jgi:hypothetical protein